MKIPRIENIRRFSTKKVVNVHVNFFTTHTFLVSFEAKKLKKMHSFERIVTELILLNDPITVVTLYIMLAIFSLSLPT